MLREKKAGAVDKLEGILSRSTIALVTDYRGLSAAEMNQLRRRLGELGIEYRVVKNTLVSFAAERAGKPGLKDLLGGPTAIAFGYGDVVEPAKALFDYIRNSKTVLSIRGGLLDRQVLSPQEVSSLSTLPSRELLIAKLLGGMQAPVSNLLNVLTANIRELVGVLQARKKQLEGG